MRRIITTASLLALLAALPAAGRAQPTGASGAINPAMRSGQGGIEAPYDAYGPRPAMRAPLNSQDRRFVYEATSAGRAEVAAGHLALSRAAEPAVSEFGRWMITDHTELNDTLGYDAERAGLTPPQGMMPKHRDMLQRLSRYYGAEFDMHYVEHQRDAHKQALELFKQEAQSGANPLLRGFAHHSEWILTQHLAETQTLRHIPQSSTARGAHMSSAPLAPMPYARRASPDLQAGTSPEVRRSIVQEGARRIEREGK